MSFDPARFTAATVTAKTVWAPGRVSLRLDAHRVFEPGQFLKIGLVIDGQPIDRAFSLANAPDDPLEVYLTAVTGGALSPHLAALQPGDTVQVGHKLAGHFTLANAPGAPTLWLLATGAGLGPFMSLLRSGRAWERHPRVVLVHGVRERAHHAYADELARMPLDTVSVLSGAEEGDLTGHIQDRLADGTLEARVEPISESSHLMLVGNPGMVRGGLAHLKGRGLALHLPRRPGQVQIERYW